MLKFWILMVLFSQTLLADYVEPHIKHTAYCQMKVVVPLTSRDPMIQEEKLLNVTNMFGAVQKWGGSLEARIVLYGAGVTLLQNPSPKRKNRSIRSEASVCSFSSVTTPCSAKSSIGIPSMGSKKPISSLQEPWKWYPCKVVMDMLWDRSISPTKSLENFHPIHRPTTPCHTKFCHPIGPRSRYRSLLSLGL